MSANLLERTLAGVMSKRDTTTWTPETEDEALSSYLLVIGGVLAAILLVWRAWASVVTYVREVSSLNNDTQRYFAIPSGNVSWWKRNIEYAPIFRKRRNREFQLSSAMNMGTLPTRMEFVILAGYLATNVAFCVINISFAGSLSAAAKLLRNRSGTLATVNMIPLFIMAGRNNPLINILGVSFDTFNLFHRWLGRIVALEAVCHTLAFLVASAAEGGWAAALDGVVAKPFLFWGLISTIALVAIIIQAASVARHAYYETFKLLHIGLAALAIAGLWYHLDLDKLPQIKWLIPAIVIWVADRAARTLRLVYRNIGAGGTKTLVEALPGNAVRVTVNMARPWTFKPGQHAYLYLPTISFWQSHPFSIAWSEEEQDLASEKLAMTKQDILSMQKTTMSYVIRARTGMTKTLYDRAAAQPDGKLWTTCFAEGPYGGLHSMNSYGTVVMFAGGVGVTFAVPFVRQLVAGFSDGTVATRKIVLVWIIQTPEHLEWIRPWMTTILAMNNRRDCLRVKIFVSRPSSHKEVSSPSSTVQMFPGRPNVDTLIGQEMEQQVGTMAVSVCGPGALSDEVRLAVRKRQYDGSVDFIDEAFTW